MFYTISYNILVTFSPSLFYGVISFRQDFQLAGENAYSCYRKIISLKGYIDITFAL